MKYATKYCTDFVGGMNEELTVHGSSGKTKIFVCHVSPKLCFLSLALEQYVHSFNYEIKVFGLLCSFILLQLGWKEQLNNSILKT